MAAVTDVVLQYPWTSVPNNSPIRKETPCVYAKAWKLNDSAIRKLVGNYVNQITNSSDSNVFDYYDKIYAGAVPADQFTFPFFGDSVVSFSNEFGDAYSGGSSTGSQAAGAGLASNIKDFAGTLVSTINEARAAITNKYGSYAEIPKFYQYAQTDDNIAVQFPLLNTVETSGDDPYKKNYELIMLLKRLNKPERLSGSVILPPHLWEITVPGYRYVRWATCDVNVDLLGSRRILNSDNKIIPEGYSVSLTFKSLTIEPLNFEPRYTGQSNGGQQI